jgi:hypothetical protein
VVSRFSLDRVPFDHWICGLLDLVFWTYGKIKIIETYRDSNSKPFIVQSVASRYIDWTTGAQKLVRDLEDMLATNLM